MITKECIKCKRPFNAWSAKGAEFIKKCSTCQNKDENAKKVKTSVSRFENDIISLDNRMKSIEDGMKDLNFNMEMLLRAQIKEDFDKLLNERIDDIISKLVEENKIQQEAFYLKLQTQIITINNRIIELEKEIADWLGLDENERN